MLSGLSRDLEEDATATAGAINANFSPDESELAENLSWVVADLFDVESRIGQLFETIATIQAKLKVDTGRLARKAFTEEDFSDYEEEEELEVEGEEQEITENGGKPIDNQADNEAAVKEAIKEGVCETHVGGVTYTGSSHTEQGRKQTSSGPRGRSRSDPISLLSDDEDEEPASRYLSNLDASTEPAAPPKLPLHVSQAVLVEQSSSARVTRSKSVTDHDIDLIAPKVKGKVVLYTEGAPARPVAREGPAAAILAQFEVKQEALVGPSSTAQTDDSAPSVKSENVASEVQSALKRKRTLSADNVQKKRSSKAAVKEEAADYNHVRSVDVPTSVKSEQTSIPASINGSFPVRIKEEDGDATIQRKHTLQKEQAILQSVTASESSLCSAVAKDTSTSTSKFASAAKQEEMQ